MNWLALVAITIFLDSIRIFIDNYTSDVFFKGRGAVSQKLFFGYTWIIASIIILAATGFNFTNTDLYIALLFVLSGIISSLSGIPYYKALEIEDSTNLGIFIQLAPILYLILGWAFLGDSISPLQLLAFVIILAAPVLIIATTRKKSRKIKLKAVFYAFLYVLIAVTANLLFVKINTENFNFLHEMALFFFGSGITSLIIVYTRPKWRRRFLSVLKQNRQKLFIPLVFNAICSFIKNITYRSALVAAPAVALASAASDSAEPIVIFFMGLLFTLIWPKFGRENLNKKTVLVHLIATVLVVTGVILLQF